MPQFPERHLNHILETQSRNFLIGHLPPEWTHQNVNYDYGQDLLIEISEQGQMRGLGLIIQIKGSQESTGNQTHENIILRRSTYNYLCDRLEVVLLVKYVASENEAYYKLLSEVVPPVNPEQESFTISIPKTNTISGLDWNIIVEYVRDITHTKLSAVRNRNNNNTQQRVL